MDLLLTEEMIERQTPEGQSIIRSLQETILRQQATIGATTARCDVLMARVKELEEALGHLVLDWSPWPAF